MALMVASVPELTKRTCAMLGTSLHSSLAISSSCAVGAPKLKPLAAVWVTASSTCGWAWPRIAGPHEPT